MIYICCQRIPNDQSLTESIDAASAIFVGESNSAYFEKIKSRADESAKESLCAYALLGRMIKKHFPFEYSAQNPLILVRNDNGKPYFESSSLKFSISHSKGIVVCALSYGDEVGVDVEATNFTPEKAQKLAARFFCEDERKAVEHDQAQFAAIWTKKEAATKLLGTNLADFMKKARENPDLSEISFHEFRYSGYPVTLCTKRKLNNTILIYDNKE